MVTDIRTNCSRHRQVFSPLEEDTDDDNDGWSDIDEVSCGSDPVDGTDMPVDENDESVMFLTLIGTMTVFQTPMKPTQASTLIQAIREPIRGIQIPMVMFL